MLNKKLLIQLAILFSLAVSCSNPPDVKVCTDLGSPQWNNFKETFIKYCEKSPDCVLQLKAWKDYLDALTVSDNGWCTNTLSDDENWVIDASAWKAIHKHSLIVPAESYGKIKAYIIKNCKQQNTCPDIATWQRKIDSIDNNIK